MSQAAFTGAFLLVFAACQETSIATFDAETPVVSSYLYAGQNLDSFRVSLSFSYAREDTLLVTLDDLDVTISDGDKNFSLVPLGNGYYHSADLLIETEHSYNMQFEWKGEPVTASTYIPGKREAALSATSIEMEKITTGGGFPGGGFTELDPLIVNWENPEGDYYYVLVENLEDAPEYINEFLAQLEEDFGRRFFNITEPEIIDFYRIDPRREITQFGTHRVIVFRVTPEYAALYETSGFSSQTITEPPSNIDNGLGIFTGVSSDTLYFEVKKI